MSVRYMRAVVPETSAGKPFNGTHIAWPTLTLSDNGRALVTAFRAVAAPHTLLLRRLIVAGRLVLDAVGSTPTRAFDSVGCPLALCDEWVPIGGIEANPGDSAIAVVDGHSDFAVELWLRGRSL